MRCAHPAIAGPGLTPQHDNGDMQAFYSGQLAVSGMLQATGYQWKNWIWPPVTVHRREEP